MSYINCGHMRTEESFTSVDQLFSGGRWWRHTEYVLRDGYLRPTANSRLEVYDAWARYRTTRKERAQTADGRDDDWIPPYAELVNLHKDLDPRLILEFSRKYGLLGSLLHQTQAVTLAPRWVALEDGQLRVPGQRQMIRINTGWIEKRSLFRPSTLGQAVGSPELEGTLVPTDQAPDAWARVGVLQRDLRLPDFHFGTVRECWAKYFPDVPAGEAETFDYPFPLSEGFWATYAEPYPSFLDSLQVLSQALWELSHHKPKGEGDAEDEDHVRMGVKLLHTLVAPASASIVPMRDGTFAQQWVCNSLLSSFAMMALHDLTESRRVRACAECGRMFVSQHPKALYCREKCRWVRVKRTQRDKLRKNAMRKRPTATKSSARKERRK